MLAAAQPDRISVCCGFAFWGWPWHRRDYSRLRCPLPSVRTWRRVNRPGSSSKSMERQRTRLRRPNARGAALHATIQQYCYSGPKAMRPPRPTSKRQGCHRECSAQQQQRLHPLAAVANVQPATRRPQAETHRFRPDTGRQQIHEQRSWSDCCLMDDERFDRAATQCLPADLQHSEHQQEEKRTQYQCNTRNGAASGSPMNKPWPGISTLLQSASMSVSPAR